MREKRPTIYDIAEATGVSVGTVNRALNNKPRISPETKALVLETAERLGYRVNPAAQALHRTPITMGAILFCPIEEYIDPIVEGMQSAAIDLEKYNVTVDIRKLAYCDGCLAQAEQLLRQFAEMKYRAVVLFLSSYEDELRAMSALIGELREQGMAIATVANDIPGSERVLHVGVDAYVAGKMAAEIMEMSCKGKDVALMVASTDSPVNHEYIRGFGDYAGEHTFSAIRIYEHRDRRTNIVEATDRVLNETPHLGGIYMATASSGIACEHIRCRGVTGLTVVTTDLLRGTPELLHRKLATATIFQNPYRQGRAAIKLLYQHLIGADTAGVHLITPRILLSSNLECYLQRSDND